MNELTLVSNSVLEKIGLRNCSKEALYYYYFVENVSIERKIYSIQEDQKHTLICVMPSKTLLILYSNDEDQAIKALNDYKSLHYDSRNA